MIRVKIIPPAGSDRSNLDEKSWAEMPDGSTVKDALKLIRCSKVKAKLLYVSVNGEKAELKKVLNDGDVVGFFSLVTGG